MLDTNNKESMIPGIPLITMKCTNIILNQMKECICKIKNENGNGTGFFCQIPNKKIKVLITNNHVINEEIIKKNDNIVISLNNDNEKRKIKINENRKIYTSIDYDTTIIEIKEKDKIKNYIELDEDIFDDIQNKCNENIYIIQYPENLNSKQEASVSYGILKEIKDEYDIVHQCSTLYGSSGSPIININNNKVIGIHKEGSSKFNYNKGTYLKYPINEYLSNINIINKKKSNGNEIDITLKIDKNDIDKDIYFLNNTNQIKEFDEINKINLKELNEINTELYINNIKYKYSKYFKPKKEGIYKIKLKIKISLKDNSYMFYRCNNITDLELSSFDTKNVTNMTGIFAGCKNLTDLDLSSFNTENVTNMSYMFTGCHNLMLRI